MPLGQLKCLKDINSACKHSWYAKCGKLILDNGLNYTQLPQWSVKRNTSALRYKCIFTDFHNISTLGIHFFNLNSRESCLVSLLEDMDRISVVNFYHVVAPTKKS